MDCRAAVAEADCLPVYTGEADLVVTMPKRAGTVMRLVLEDLVSEANERIASGWRTKPIAYGCDDKAKQLGVRRSAVTEALHALERHGGIERVHRLPLLGFEGSGAWTYRLVVTPAVEVELLAPGRHVTAPERRVRRPFAVELAGVQPQRERGQQVQRAEVVRPYDLVAVLGAAARGRHGLSSVGRQ
jgi:hypothetical protein